MSGDTNGHAPDFTVSVIKAAMDTATKDASFRAIMADIAGPRWKVQVELVRSAYNDGATEAINEGADAAKVTEKAKDAANEPKKKLPGILFSGTFSSRSAKALLHHSGLICADLDALDVNLEATRDHIVADPHTLACFVSPTGTGLKVIFRCDPARPHLDSFKAARRHVLESFGLQIDEACKDVSRICFVSHDPEAFVAADATPLSYPPEPVEFRTPLQQPAPTMGDIPPGDDYDARADLATLLTNHGWTKCGAHGWTRPGKTSGVSATWDNVPRRFYVFSSSTEFESNHVYRPWHVFALLECGGDFARAARELYAQGFGTRASRPKPAAPSSDFDFGSEPDDGTTANASHPADLESGPRRAIELVGRSFGDFELPPIGEPSILLGDRYLGKGDGAILASSSGMGKSSLLLQLATGWALGRGFYDGLKPTRPLKTLIFQSEDSDGDVAEVRISLYYAMKLTVVEIAQVEANVIIVPDRVHRGVSFHVELKRQIAIHHPDIVGINPLLAYIGGDVNDAEAAGAFLRDGLNGLNEPPTHAYVVVHHTAKPPKEKQDRKWSEVMYDMAGSADLTNWARAIINLRPADEEGQFNLHLSKRGVRAGYTHIVKGKGGAVDFREATTKIGLRHSKDRLQVGERNLRVIHWEPCEPSMEATSAQSAAGRKRTTVFADVAAVFPVGADQATGFRILHRAAQQIRPNLGTSAFVRLLDEAVEDGMLMLDKGNPKQPKYYIPKA